MASYPFSFSSNLCLANHLPPKVTIALILECLFCLALFPYHERRAFCSRVSHQLPVWMSGTCQRCNHSNRCCYAWSQISEINAQHFRCLQKLSAFRATGKLYPQIYFLCSYVDFHFIDFGQHFLKTWFINPFCHFFLEMPHCWGDISLLND